MNLKRVIFSALGCAVAWSMMASTFSPPEAFASTAATESSPAVPANKTLAGKVIVVDAGHGGPDSGARSADGVYEKAITLAIAHKLVHYLQQGGAYVYMTRETDRDLATEADRAARRRHQGDLRNRVRFTRSKHPDMVLSVHCNAIPSVAWSGATTIYMKGNEDGKRLATLIQDEFKQNLLPTHRSIDDMDSLYLLKRIDGPVALAEVGFLSNPREATSLQSAAYQDKIAACMYIAAVRYFAGTS